MKEKISLIQLIFSLYFTKVPPLFSFDKENSIITHGGILNFIVVTLIQATRYK